MMLARIVMLFAGQLARQDTLRAAREVEFRLDPVLAFDRNSLADAPPDMTPSLVVLGPNLEAFVLDAKGSRILAFARSGQLLWVSGRSGRGPGEFVAPATLAYSAEGLWVGDIAERRVQLFSPKGRLVSEHSMLSSTAAGGIPSPPAVVLADRTGLVEPIKELSNFHPSSYLVRIDLEGRVVNQLAKLPLKGMLLRYDFPTADLQAFAVQPFAFFDRVGLTSAYGGRAYIVEQTDPPRGARRWWFRVVGIGSGGDTAYSLRKEYRPLPLEESRFESDIAERVSGLLAVGRPAMGSRPDPAAVVRRSVVRPRTLPPVTKVVAAQDGRVYLRREDPGTNEVRWTILNGTGELVGWFRAPTDLEVGGAKGDTVLAISTGKDGNRTVRQYLLRRLSR